VDLFLCASFYHTWGILSDRGDKTLATIICASEDAEPDSREVRMERAGLAGNVYEQPLASIPVSDPFQGCSPQEIWPCTSGQLHFQVDIPVQETFSVF